MMKAKQKQKKGEYGKLAALSDAVIIALVLVAIVGLVAGVAWLVSNGIKAPSAQQAAQPIQEEAGHQGLSVLGLVVGAVMLLVSTFVLSWTLWHTSRDIVNRPIVATDRVLNLSWLFSGILGLAGCVVVGAATRILWGFLSLAFLFFGPSLFLPVHLAMVRGIRQRDSRKLDREMEQTREP